MITGFNTDVRYGGLVYHVQTEDRGRDHPILESLVYVGGTIIAKKATTYGDQVSQGANEEIIASLLRKQHQVMIAAIKAGRIEDLVRLSKEDAAAAKEEARANGARTQRREPLIEPPALIEPPRLIEPSPLEPKKMEIPLAAPAIPQSASPAAITDPAPRELAGQSVLAGPDDPNMMKPVKGGSGRLALNLDQVINDYLKRSSEQGRLDLKVLTPTVFTAGKAISLRVQVSRNGGEEAEAIVTVKIIGTAFKPQVYMARADKTGVANFNLTLPAFTAGTAAIVIEAQSNKGRGELKHLIRRA